MLRLNLKKEAYWLDLPAGVRVRIRPLTTAIMSAAQSSVIKKITLLRAEIKKHDEIGAENADLPDLENEQVRLGLSESMLIKALALAAIMEWEGVMQPDKNEPAEINEQNISDLMDIWFVAQEFWKNYTSSLSLLEAEGNVSRPVVSGTLAAGLPIAGDAQTNNSPVAEEKATR